MRNAAPTETLRELIERRDDWESRRGDRLNKQEFYNQETVRTIVANEDDDPWIFATVRPSSASTAATSQSDAESTVGTIKRIVSPPVVCGIHGKAKI